MSKRRENLHERIKRVQERSQQTRQSNVHKEDTAKREKDNHLDQDAKSDRYDYGQGLKNVGKRDHGDHEHVEDQGLDDHGHIVKKLETQGHSEQGCEVENKAEQGYGEHGHTEKNIGNHGHDKDKHKVESVGDQGSDEYGDTVENVGERGHAGHVEDQHFLDYGEKITNERNHRQGGYGHVGNQDHGDHEATVENVMDQQSDDQTVEKRQHTEPVLVRKSEQADSSGDPPVHATDQSENVELPEELPRRTNKLLKTFGAIALAVGILTFGFVNTPTVDTSEPAQHALSEQVSTELSTGVRILSADEELGAQDHTIVHNSDAEETKIWVWDYAAEDGDYVQVLVNGTPITDPFMIKHKPKEITVPAVGTVEIKGIRDGGGGITYAVRYDINGTTYFNTAPLNGENTYELVRE